MYTYVYTCALARCITIFIFVHRHCRYPNKMCGKNERPKSKKKYVDLSMIVCARMCVCVWLCINGLFFLSPNCWNTLILNAHKYEWNSFDNSKNIQKEMKKENRNAESEAHNKANTTKTAKMGKPTSPQYHLIFQYCIRSFSPLLLLLRLLSLLFSCTHSIFL